MFSFMWEYLSSIFQPINSLYNIFYCNYCLLIEFFHFCSIFILRALGNMFSYTCDILSNLTIYLFYTFLLINFFLGGWSFFLLLLDCYVIDFLKMSNASWLSLALFWESLFLCLLCFYNLPLMYGGGLWNGCFSSKCESTHHTQKSVAIWQLQDLSSPILFLNQLFKPT